MENILLFIVIIYFFGIKELIRNRKEKNIKEEKEEIKKEEKKEIKKEKLLFKDLSNQLNNNLQAEDFIKNTTKNCSSSEDLKKQINYKNINKFKIKEDNTLFLQEIKKRKIKYLVHFTTLSNLKQIFNTGKILSKNILTQQHINFNCNDTRRYDGDHHINLSIMHPNIYLLDYYKKNSQDHDIWVVLKIDTKYILHTDTQFSVTNASNTYNKNVIGITEDYEKFIMLFAPEIIYETTKGQRKISRYANLAEKYPTDLQAEVLVKCPISIYDILEIVCENELDCLEIKKQIVFLNPPKISINQRLFSLHRF